MTEANSTVRRRTGIGKAIGLRLYPAEEAILDRYRARQDREISRLDALRVAIRVLDFTPHEWNEIESWAELLPSWSIADAVRAAVRLHLSQLRANPIDKVL
jgi:hypothetical protein